MSTIGGLKASRTRVCGHLNQIQQEALTVLNHRRNIKHANPEQLAEIQELAQDLIGQLQPSLQKLEIANQKLEDEYVKNTRSERTRRFSEGVNN